MAHHYDGPEPNENQEQIPAQEPIGEVLKKYKQMREEGATPKPPITPDSIPEPKAVPPMPKPTSFDQQQFENTMSRETDPDLMTSYEIIKLPSKGKFYKNGLSEVTVEYMTSKDEDILTTPSLIENGTVIDVLLKRKIKTAGVNPNDLLVGDRSAIILFLRSSSYGSEYSVQVPDPRTNALFKTQVDLTKLAYKKVEEQPDEQGHFTVQLPMRKKMVKFKLLTAGEETSIFKNAEAFKEASGQEFSDYSTLKLKSHVVSIDGKSDRGYISKFIDAMPALDALTIRRKILNVSPDVDMAYEFSTKDGYKFNADLSIGIDFFFPNT